MATILVVEDNELLGRSLAASLADDGHRAEHVPSAEDGLAWLERRNADLILLDCQLPGMSGVELLERLCKSHPATAVIMMTANADVATAVKAMKIGASDFLIKPVDLDAVSVLAEKNLRERRLAQQVDHERRQRNQQFGLHQIIGDCPGIEKAKSIVRRLSGIQVSDGQRQPNVLITGPTGTGKDLFAQAIHYDGPLREGPFVHVNAAALPDKLVESELFGHVPGAFTGAAASKRGLFEVADGGTLFLDEIGALDMALQAKVLTAIEHREIRPVGASETTQVNVRLIAAMNQDPIEWVAAGNFREDLYHRLRVIQIELPALRERGDDVEALADHFLRVYCQKFQMDQKKFTPGARAALRLYDWPGNIRELSHSIESAVLLSGDEIGVDLLPARRSQSVTSTEEIGHESIALDFSRGPIPLDAVEKELILRAMRETKSNVTRAAQLLAVSRDTLRYRLEKYGINGSASRAMTEGA